MFIEPVEIIDKIKFTLFSPDMIRKMSAVKVYIPDTYGDDGYPIDGGLVDMHLGVIDPGLKCKTCGGTAKECPGHFGHIELVRPVIHVSFAKQIYKVLKSVCPYCKKVVSDGENVPKKCPFCKKEIPQIKFIKPTNFYRDGKEMLPNEVQDWLTGISDEDIKKLGFDPVYARPEWMVLTVLPIPPVNIRPSIILESGERSEDDLTHKLVDIIRINQKLEANINAGAPQLIIEDLWQLLQYHVTTYFDNETAGIPAAKHRSGRPLKTISQRLKGKEGRFRYNLSGKRVNFSARTVVSPDPNISINEVGVPQPIAENLTIPMAVTKWNIEKAKSLVKSTKYPRAIYVIRIDGRKIKVTDINRDDLAENLKIGWIVERQLMDGDITLFNRQPSLHRISMMGHEVKVLPGRTFRLNPTVCPPYNADFDGDEMNLHVLQTPDSQAEARILMKVENQILSPRHGNAIIKPEEDYITGLFFFTKDDTLFTKEEAAKILFIADIKELPKSDKKAGYSGKFLFSQFLPKDMNLETEVKGRKLKIKKGILVEGEVGSKEISRILEHLFIHYGPKVTSKFLDNITRASLFVLTHRGFSVSMKDYYLSDKALNEIKKLEEKMDQEIENLILQYKNKTLKRAPGMSLRETLESAIMSLTSQTRKEMGKVVKEDLGKENPSIVMASIGSRGSLLNAIQMSAAVAQQAVRNKRPNRGYFKRNLIFYKPGKLSGRERGFVYHSFRRGLEPDEFWQHAMGGRESLVNTAIRTSRSGYMQRRLVSALQDFVVYKDYTVKDASGIITQFVYGGDKIDPMFSHANEF